MASIICPSQGDDIDKHGSSLLICAPCLICGQFLLEGAAEGGHHVDVETSLFQLLCKLFGMVTESNRKVCNDEPADGYEQEDNSFCDTCKDKLETLMELKRKLEELQEQIKTAKEVFRKQLDNSEGIIQKSRIYQTDPRCRVRRQLLQKIMTGSGGKNNLNSSPSKLIHGDESSSSTRTSSRFAVTKSSQNILVQKSHISSAFVKLSAADRECAELAKENLLAKQHPVMDMNEESIRNTPPLLSNLNINAELDDDDIYAETDNFSDLLLSVQSTNEPRNRSIKRGRKKKNTTPRKPVADTIRMKNKKGSQRSTRSSSRVKSKTPPRNNAGATRKFATTSNSVSARIRKLRTQNAKGNDDKAFIASANSPAEDEANNNSANELELEEAATNNNKGKSANNRIKPYVYHIDEATGNCTLLGITLEKLAKNERGQKRFRCTKCSRVVTIIGRSIKYSIRRHVVRVHSPDLKKKKTHNIHYVDDRTGNFTLLKVTLEKMPESEDGKTQYKCKECSEIIVVSKSKPGEFGSLRDHVFRSHTDKLSCKECGTKYDSIGRRNDHMKTFHNPETLVVPCPTCGKPFTSKQSVEQHQLTHLNEKEREELRRRAKGKSVFSRWERTQCEECGHICPKNYLENHRKRKHGTEEERAKLQHKKKLCPECGKYVVMLHSHMDNMHSAFPKYPCVHCEKRFRTTSRLKGHVDVVHKKIHRFKCTICPKTFYIKGKFDSHMRLHLNIRPFQCELCPSAFTEKKHLVQHAKVHRGDASKS